MAIRGKKPTATVIKLQRGTFRKARATEGAEPKPVGGVEKPPKMKAAASRLWDKFIARAFWLTWADSTKAMMWCYMQAEFEKDPAKMTAARIGQLRALGSELGMDPSSRARLGANLRPGVPSGGEGNEGGEEKPANPAAKYW